MDKEQILLYHRKYRAEHREQINEYYKKWREEHPERNKEANKRNYENVRQRKLDDWSFTCSLIGEGLLQPKEQYGTTVNF
jgi:hypothetical protein